MYVIGKTFEFEAAHSLPHLPPEHKCANQHGHSYRVHLIFQSDVLLDGFVFDYGDLSLFKQYVDDNLDHRDLNNVVDVSSAEMLASFLFDRLQQFRAKTPDTDHWRWVDDLHTVVVQETRKTFAAYSPYEYPIVWTS